jgi:AcrR family transcriptional regulator
MFIAITRTEVSVARNKYPEETVEKILDVAERLLVERGYEHTTMI